METESVSVHGVGLAGSCLCHDPAGWSDLLITDNRLPPRTGLTWCMISPPGGRPTRPRTASRSCNRWVLHVRWAEQIAACGGLARLNSAGGELGPVLGTFGGRAGSSGACDERGAALWLCRYACHYSGHSCRVCQRSGARVLRAIMLSLRMHRALFTGGR